MSNITVQYPDQGTMLTHTLKSSPLWATTGYVAVDSTNQFILVSFRGTQNLTNYLADVLLPLTDVSSICSGCQALYGFWEAWLDAKTVVTNAVYQAHLVHSSYKIVVSGHSFGAAIVTLATADLRKSGLSIDMVGLPVGNYQSNVPIYSIRSLHLVCVIKTMQIILPTHLLARGPTTDWNTWTVQFR